MTMHDKSTTAAELSAMVANIEIEELESRLEFLSCHWGGATPESGDLFHCGGEF
jgi:hypothetical protein